jgi:RNA polymerase sigma-70 factor, ECF subfamily
MEQGAAIACEAGLEDFDSLVRPRVFRFILASLRDRETAENLTQDCFIRAFKAREQFRGASGNGTCSIATWLMTIAANLVRNHEASSRLKFWRRALVGDLGDWIPDRQVSPEDQALEREQVEAIWRVAARLPERQRTVFLLRFVEDMDLVEIAAVAHMKEGTVKTHLFRALNSVRTSLRPRTTEHGGGTL